MADLVGSGDLTIPGQPPISFRAASASSRVQVDVRLFDVAPAGTKLRITRGTYTIERRPCGAPIGVAVDTILTYGSYWRARTITPSASSSPTSTRHTSRPVESPAPQH